MSDADKQMIIKAILDLKQEVDRLKAIVGSEPVQTKEQVLPEHKAMDYEEPEEQVFQEPAAPEISARSMREANDELIDKVLAKYGGKVKPAAQELGISERTIYRKLAERKQK